MDKHLEVVINKHGLAAAPITPQLFGNAGKEHMEKYGEFLWWLIYNRSLLSEREFSASRATFTYLTLHTLTSVSIFSLLFSVNIQFYYQEILHSVISSFILMTLMLD